MASGILENDWVVSARQAPWHGIGTVVEDAMTSAEAIEMARLGWTVSLRDLYFASGPEARPLYRLAPKHKGTVRDDTSELLGVVGSRYKVFQNRAAFALCDALGANGDARFETAGSLQNGRVVWVLMQKPNTIQVNGDKVSEYILLATSHDGSLALTVVFTPVRVVCANTLSIALSGNRKRFSARHTFALENSAERAKKVLGLSEDYFEVFKEKATQLVRAQIGREDAQRMTAEAFGVKLEVLKEAIEVDTYKGKLHAPGNALALFANGAGNHGRTAWDWYNGVTEYLTHEARVRGAGDNEIKKRERRLVRNWLGEGATIRQRAWDVAQQYVSAGLV